MRILFFSHYFPPEVNAPASRTHENCKRWVRAGHDVTVVTCAPNCPDGVVYDGYKNRLWQSETVDGIRVIRVWTYVAANKGTVRRILNFLTYMGTAVLASLLLKRPDVIIATSPQFFCGWAGRLAGLLRRVPFILEIRDLWPESIVAVGAITNGRLLAVLERLERWMYAGATHIVTVGEGYKAKLLEKGVPSQKIDIVTNGADLTLFTPRPPDEALKRSLGLDGKFVCSFVGTLGMSSGLDIIPRAAEILRDKGCDHIAFLLVGDGATREQLQRTVREKRLDNVVFTGRQDKAMMPHFLSMSDVCLAHLQRKDLFKTVLPSKIFEAAAMRKPIILGVEGCAAELVRQAGAGVCIEPENAEQLAAAVETLAEDPQLQQTYAASGYDHVVKHFNRETLAAEYLQIIARIANGTKPREESGSVSLPHLHANPERSRKPGRITTREHVEP